MIQRLSAQLPLWMQSRHPVLRYELGKAQRVSRRTRLFRLFVVALVAALLMISGYIIATGFNSRPAGQSLTESINAVIFWPTLVLQVILGILAFALTGNAVDEEIRRNNWDNLRATIRGAELSLRTRWAAVFYRLRGLLGLVLLVRVVLIFGILYDLTAFQGRYLDLLMNGVTPRVPLVGSILLVSLFMTASLLLPLTSTGLDAALGLMLGTVVRQRTYAFLIQVFIILIRLALVAALLSTMTQFINNQLQLEEPAAWLLAGGYAALGDWGLAYLNIDFYGQIWASVPYGVAISFGLLVFAVLQAALADLLVAMAVRVAERRG
jgi:hypothetical protein